jgi:hypothetical protein
MKIQPIAPLNPIRPYDPKSYAEIQRQIQYARIAGNCLVRVLCDTDTVAKLRNDGLSVHYCDGVATVEIR